MKAVTAAQMRRIDARAVTRYGIPVHVLMDNAGRCVAEAVRDLCPRRAGRVVALCGGGHNGGDGVAAARYLRGWGYSVKVLWLKNPVEWKGSAALHYAIARRMGVSFQSFVEIPPAHRVRALRQAAIVIDALLGTGATGPIRLPLFDAIATINAARKPVVAVDLPSGLNADTGRPMETAVKANVTVTLAAPKIGLLKPAARPYVGNLIVADIGLPIR